MKQALLPLSFHPLPVHMYRHRERIQGKNRGFDSVLFLTSTHSMSDSVGLSSILKASVLELFITDKKKPTHGRDTRCISYDLLISFLSLAR